MFRSIKIATALAAFFLVVILTSSGIAQSSSGARAWDENPRIREGMTQQMIEEAIAKKKREEVVFSTKHWFEYDKYVQSHTTVRLDKYGNWRIETIFSNGNREFLKEMSLKVLVLTNDEKCLFGAVHEVRLSPSLGGSANEYVSTSTGKISEATVSLAKKTLFKASRNTSETLAAYNDIDHQDQTVRCP